MSKSVLVALSGGIDSAVTAMLLKQQNYLVTGLYFNLYPKDKKGCSYNSVESIAKRLDIPLVQLDITEEFSSSVVDYFVKEYLVGRTPCPCSLCNDIVKWEQLFGYAIENDFQYIATGHYVRIIKDDSCYYIQKGMDLAKDQSYFMWRLRQQYLAKTITPLGDYTKSEVRKIAVKHGFEDLAYSPESMGVCFLNGSDYRSFLGNKAPSFSKRKGLIITETDEIVGEHNGVYHYTVGQKKGIKRLPKGYCVINIIENENKVVLGKWDSLFLKFYILRAAF